MGVPKSIVGPGHLLFQKDKQAYLYWSHSKMWQHPSCRHTGNSVIPIDSSPGKRLTTTVGIARAPLPFQSGQWKTAGEWTVGGDVGGAFSQLPLPGPCLALTVFLYLRPQLPLNNPLQLLAMWTSSLEKWLFSSFAHFSIRLFMTFVIELYEIFIYCGY